MLRHGNDQHDNAYQKKMQERAKEQERIRLWAMCQQAYADDTVSELI